MNNFFTRIITLLFLLHISFFAVAQGDLLIAPKRIVFDGSKRVEEINLANIGKDTATYTISFMQYRMDENGKFEPVSDQDSTLKFAHKNLRFFPRTVTLAPKEAQSVKVQVIKTNELTTGEYRSHLYFRAVPNKNDLGDEAPEPTQDSGFSIKLTPVFGISIPVIIRVGETYSTSHFSNAKFEFIQQTHPALSITLNRTGNISAYGDIAVNYIGANKKAIPVCFMKGLAVYVPNSKRILQLPLVQKEGVDYKSGKLQVVYTDQSPKAAVICQSEIIL
ncbi:MAG TPA: hypothetical protein PK504_07580 [Ferruginibacter sp.]|nr:hypothetical protein [Ferruginibacter sp.]